jgi:DNA-binding response OmpR family regulator
MLIEQTLEDLEDEGVELLTASNGQEALDLIIDEKPDLVFLDVMMPKMNGIEVCRKVKQELKIEGVFIIILTAKGQELDKQKGKDVEADIYMTKPFDPDDLLGKAREALNL